MANVIKYGAVSQVHINFAYDLISHSQKIPMHFYKPALQNAIVDDRLGLDIVR